MLIMSNFTGFSEEDIVKLQNGQSPVLNNTKRNNTQLAVDTHKKIQNIIRRNEKILNEKMQSLEINDIPQEAKLSLPESKTPLTEPPSLFNEVLNDKGIECEMNNDDNLNGNCNKREINLDEFEAKQKYMQEQNKRRKELLARALEDRTKKTLEEQQKLNEIQNEFKRLDANLSNDVKILRKQIEDASIDYSEAQKKYNRIEREFLDAKLNLHQKLERKEMLTEYLCAIIEKNEERKAEKLNELLQKLGTSVEIND